MHVIPPDWPAALASIADLKYWPTLSCEPRDYAPLVDVGSEAVSGPNQESGYKRLPDGEQKKRVLM